MAFDNSFSLEGLVRRGDKTKKAMEKMENKEHLPLFYRKNRCCYDYL